MSIREKVWNDPIVKCAGKHPHASRADALKQIRAQEKRRNFKPRHRGHRRFRFNAYWCDICHAWHVGNAPL